MPRPARRLLAAITLAVAIGAAGALAAPANAQVPSVDPPVAVAPEEGAPLGTGSVVLVWTPVDAPEGYEVRWSAADGNAGTAATTSTSTRIEVGSGTFTWQVRALPSGQWSVPAAFSVDLELPTLPLGQEPVVAPVVVAGAGLGTVPGSVWIGGALGFSAVFLAVVVLQSRQRREQDA